MNPVRKAAFEVPNKHPRRVTVARFQQPRCKPSLVSASIATQVHTSPAIGSRACTALVTFFCLSRNERPDFVALNPGSWKVAERLVLVFGARRADNSQATEGSHPWDTPSHADSGADRATLDQGRDDRYPLVHADKVAHGPIIRERFRIRKQKAQNMVLLLGFLGLGPACFSRFFGTLRALFWGHGFQSPFTADLATLGPHGSHYLLFERKRNLFGFNRFKHHSSSILDSIKFFAFASPLWHNYLKRGMNQTGSQAVQISNRPTTPVGV